MPLTQVSQAGAVTQTLLNQINGNFAAVSQPDIWVRPQNGLGGTPTGTYDNPYTNMALAASALQPGMTVGVLGVLTEEFTSRLGLNDVTIIGMGNQPRQATTSGVPNGGGATWLSPSGGTGTLLTIQGQGWRVQNLYLNNSATGATTACIKILTTGDPPAAADGAHAQILGNVLTGGNFGVYASGGTNFVTIDGNTFFNFTGSGDCAIAQTAGAGIGTLWGWKVTNNFFYDNANSVILPSSVGFYIGNTFVSAGHAVTATTLLSLTGGSNNVIYNNKFGLASNAAGIGTIVAMGTTPTAGPNFYSDQTEYDQPS